jgi:Icc-related predicted phosphoesterase
MSRWSCFHVSDLHGRTDRYRKLYDAIRRERPRVVLLAGDLLPFGRIGAGVDFISDYMAPEFERIRGDLGAEAPEVLLIPGNDDRRDLEPEIEKVARRGVWHSMHRRSLEIDGVSFFGYACVPPTPFQLKDWERYDVSRYVDPGSLSPEDGYRTVSVSTDEVRGRTIGDDLADLTDDRELDRAVFLFHSPPYRTLLDRAALDGLLVDHVPLDIHVGSVAIRRFIEQRQPLVTLHGHIHESARLTGSFSDVIGRTRMFSAAHDGPELALVRFDLEDLDGATRELL